MTGQSSGTGKKPGARSTSTPAQDRSGAAQAVFVERQSYRRRRLVDIARLLPLLGVMLLLVPLLWPESEQGAIADGDVPTMPMSDAMTYIFAVWAALIVGSVLFGIAVRRWAGDERQTDPGQG